jgi:hypothetical protein
MTSDHDDTNVPITPRQGSGTLVPGIAQREAQRGDGPVAPAPATPSQPIPEPAAQWEPEPELPATPVSANPSQEPGFLDQNNDGSGWDDVSDPAPVPVPVPEPYKYQLQNPSPHGR